MDPAGKQSFRQVSNLAGPIGGFVISRIDYRRTLRYTEARGLALIAVVHSHSSSVEMSDADRRNCGTLSVPFVIVHLQGDVLEYRVYRPGKVGKSEALPTMTA